MPKSPPTPEQRIKELEEKLRLAEQKAEFFEAVVDVMEKDYGVTEKKAARQVLTQRRVAGLTVSRAYHLLGIRHQAW
ncbi:transposase [Alcanivorax xiamenensis]|uniref:Transposase n=1 Tax=Alcanivorax xiamenensis TaxID=1177156 RepID=A0ABQ6Y291_9GAMM|nr:transposase [Alcanivorax xiamenensis]